MGHYGIKCMCLCSFICPLTESCLETAVSQALVWIPVSPNLRLRLQGKGPWELTLAIEGTALHEEGVSKQFWNTPFRLFPPRLQFKFLTFLFKTIWEAVCKSFPCIIPLFHSCVGVQNRPPPNVSLWYVNYFELSVIKTLQAHKKLLAPSFTA